MHGPHLHSGLSELVAHAGPVAKFVLLVLVVFSVASWAVIVAKWWQFRRVQANNRKFMAICNDDARPSLIADAAKKLAESPLAKMYSAAYRQFAGVTVDLDSVHRSLRRTSSIEIERLERTLPFLATTASATPFIGLFGTVWGVMGSFQGIGAAGTASLAAVAPGISEALIATAAGLAAAIPAVIGYNYFLTRIRRWATEMDGFTLELLNLLNRSGAKVPVTEDV